MLTHMVVWKYLPETTQATRDKHVAGLRSLAGLVTGLESLAVGFDTLHLPRSYDTGLVAVFRDLGAQQGMGQVFSMVMPMQPLDLIIVGVLWITILAATRDMPLVWAARIVTRWVPVEK